MNSHVPSRAPIVVGVDGSRESNRALKWAAHEAAHRGVSLHILHVGPWFEVTDAEPAPAGEAWQVETASQRLCADAAKAARDWEPELDLSTSTVPAPTADALVDASRTAATVVLGARGLGAVKSVVLGSVSIEVAARAYCPVVIVREAATSTIADARVILGFDGFPHSIGAIAYAFEYAADRNRGLTVVHAWTQDWRDRSLGSDTVQRFQRQYPTVDVRRDVMEGDAIEELVRQSENACLLVVGTRGRGPVAGLVEGSVSQQLLRRAHCPVAVVHEHAQDPALRLDDELRQRS